MTSSFDVAEVALQVVGEIAISDRQINKLTTAIGEELAADREARTRHYVEQPLPRQATVAEVPPDLAAVFCDGGRLRTCQPDQGRGIHRPHWRETKNAAFHRLESRSFDADPQPDLPDCFRNQADFVHPLEYVYTAAKAIHPDAAARWRQYLDWVTACWQGRVHNVIAQLEGWQSQLGPLPEGAKIPHNDPRKIVQATARYLANNRSRMDYPRYRRSGLPVTSSLAESLVKQVGKRVKGTEKFWNDGPCGEAILQVRAAVIAADDRLQRWIRSRPVSPFSPRCRRILQANSA